MIEHINVRKDKNHGFLSIDGEKAYDKIQHPFLKRSLHHVGIERIYLNIIKVMYERPRVTIILNGDNVRNPVVYMLSTVVQHSTGSPSHNKQTKKKRNRRYPN